MLSGENLVSAARCLAV